MNKKTLIGAVVILVLALGFLAFNNSGNTANNAVKENPTVKFGQLSVL